MNSYNMQRRNFLFTTVQAMAFVVLIPMATGCQNETVVDPVPAVLRTLETSGEGAVDHALNNQIATVRADAVLVRDSWRAFRPRAVQDGATMETLTQMDTAVQELEASAAMMPEVNALARKANAIGAPMEALFARYVPPVPSSLLTLDYLGREVQLDARDRDFARAGRDLQSIVASWTSGRGLALSRGGTTQVMSVDASIQGIRAGLAASDGAAVEREALRLLEAVDLVEQVFTVADSGD
jgi:hypothetical protein